MASPTAPPPPTDALHGGDYRLRGRVFLPPPGARRTPDHPPYAEMIQVALRALAEDGGSTAADISRRIAAVYLDLPWAHERLLPHYLGRLIAAGDVFVASPGRYVLSSPPTPVGDADHNPDPRSASFAVHRGGSTAATAATLPPPSSRGAASATALPDDGAEEGLGNRTLTVAAAAASSGGHGESQCYHSSVPATAVTRLDLDDGGPSMPDPLSSAAIVVLEDGRRCGHGRPSGTTCDNHTYFVEARGRVKRGRGRPPGRGRGRGPAPYGMRYHRVPSSGTHVCDPGACGILVPKSGKGGPLDDSFVLSRHGQKNVPMFEPSVVPKRGRGRPRKWQPPMVTLDAVSADGHLSNFTNSGDPKRVELNEHAYPSSSHGDGTSTVGGERIHDCSAAPRLRVILRLPSKPEPKPVNLSSLVDQTAVHVPKCQRTSIDRKPRRISTKLFEERVSNGPLIQSTEQMVHALSASIHCKPLKINTAVFEERVNNEPSIQGSECALSAGVDHEPMKINTTVFEERVNNEPLIQKSEQVLCALSASVDDKSRKVNNKLFEELESNEPLIQSSEQMVCALTASVDHEPMKINTSVFEERVSNEPLIQISEQVVCAMSASVDHEPRKVINKLFEERESNEPLIQSSEQMVCALPACVAPLPNNIINSRPRIEGWVQVLLALQPATVNVEWARKKKKNKSHCIVGKLFHPTEQLRPEDFLLTTDVEKLAQVDACLQTFTSKQSSSVGLLQAKMDENRAHMERYIHQTSASVLNVDPKGYFQNAEEENQLPVDGNQESMSDALFQAVVVENVPHVVESGQTGVIGCSVLDGSLQTGNEELRTQAREFIELLPSEQFTLSDSLQIRLENEANMEGPKQLLTTGLSKPEGSLHREEIMFHYEKHMSECLVKQLFDQDSLESETQDGRCVQKFSVEHPRPGDDLLVDEMSEPHTKECLQMPPIFGDDFQTEDKSETLSVECAITCTAEQFALDDTLQRQESNNQPRDEEFVQERMQCSKFVHELQSEKKKESHSEDCVQVLLHEQAKFQDDFPFENAKNVTHAAECMIEFPGNDPAICDCSMMHHFQEGSHDELFNQELLVEQKISQVELLTEDGNKLYVEKYIQVPYEEQPECQVDLSSEADENGRYAEECVLADPDNGPDHDHYLQIEELEKGPEDEKFTQEIPTGQHPTGDNLQMEMDYIESHADEGLQVSLQEQDKPQGDRQMEDDGSNAHTESFALERPFEKSDACDFLQIHESQNDTQMGEINQEPPPKRLKTEYSLKEENNKVLLDDILQSPVTALSRTDDPLQLKGGKNVSLKKNRKNPRSHRLWYEG